MAYVMNEGPPLAMPDAYYYATILDGYRDCGFDEGILKQAVMHTKSLQDAQKRKSLVPFYTDVLAKLP
ncbi:hypothetical protein SDC9_139690 [bioreactor metagenome]|uniref:Uncharacterized protein n=1 Tax=bioreactor metagenome TaxID=1076179 RepID=A0A645DTF4_9ZZZZ